MFKKAVLLLLLSAAPAAAGEPSDLVARFYSGELSLFDDETANSHTGGSLAAFLEEDRKLAVEQEGPGCLDFDPAIDAQDFDDDELKRSLKLTENTEGDGSAVTARFTLFGEPREIFWQLQRIDGIWRITDIASDGGGWRLSDMACEAQQ